MADVSDVWVGDIRSPSVIQFVTQELQIVSLGRMIRLGGSVDERTDLPHLRAPCSRSSHGYHPSRTADSAGYLTVGLSSLATER
jgi:hypothetical protein